MFSEMMATLRRNRLPDPAVLQKRFDFAMTKKLGILNLPSTFWMQDPKINPPAKELFWAALLLRDRERIDQAMSVLATEKSIRSRSNKAEPGKMGEYWFRDLAEELLAQCWDSTVRENLRQDLSRVIPEIMALNPTGECCE